MCLIERFKSVLEDSICVILLLIVNRTIEVNCPTQFESRPSALFQYCSCVLEDSICVILLLIVNKTIEVNCSTQFERRPSGSFQYCSCVLVDLKLKRENGGNAKKTQKHTGFDVFKEFENFLNSGI